LPFLALNFLFQNQKKAVLVENLILADKNKRLITIESFIYFQEFQLRTG